MLRAAFCDPTTVLNRMMMALETMAAAFTQ
jgi:hypothetical protein